MILIGHQKRLQRGFVSCMSIPAPLIRLIFNPCPIDADDRDTRFNQTPREQHALCITRPARTIANVVGFCREIECLTSGGGTEQPKRLLCIVVESLHLPTLQGEIEMSIHLIHQRHSGIEPKWTDLFR